MSDNKRVNPPGIDLDKKQISFDLIKGNFFRVVPVDGIFGGIGPRGQMRMNFFSERWPIPKRMVCEITENGELKEEIYELREARDAVVREIEVEVVMDLATAKGIADWMHNTLKQVGEEEAEQVAKEDQV